MHDMALSGTSRGLAKRNYLNKNGNGKWIANINVIDRGRLWWHSSPLAPITILVFTFLNYIMCDTDMQLSLLPV